MYHKFFKRIFDIGFAICVLIITFPILSSAILLLFFQNRGKIFFLQQRPGLFGKPFEIIKLKTMNDIFDEKGNALPDEKRITKVGKLIRSLSIDELPQLINVIKGDMSIIGPRPLLISYLGKYSNEQAKRHNVRPGITGWAQVNGRNAINWEEKFKLDVYYVNHINFFLDLKILYKTILNVFFRKNINSKDHATMEEFKGN
jgi:lipopolysaccharide/colanic/teichoic acid biosynthesis glycosyltransferase